MKRKEFLRYVAAGIALPVLPKMGFNSKRQILPEVLLLGDSISIGYTPFVKEFLRGRANVTRPLLKDGSAENCNGTTYGAENIDRWIGSRKWDLIHFNFGLHDLKHVDPITGEASTKADDPLQADIKTYSRNLKFIAGRLKMTNARLIFATTTPVPDGPVSPLREPENVVLYNASAAKIMKREKIAINDLYSYVLPLSDKIQLPHNVHFTDEGYRKLAEVVAGKIISFI